MRSFNASLGTIPDYATEIKGLPLSGVAKGGPADEAGVIAGDIIGTVIVSHTVTNVVILALIVLVRAFLSMTLELGTEGRLPWKGHRNGHIQEANSPAALDGKR